MATYKVKDMRFVLPSGTTAERHPERFGTVFGIFHSEDGKQKLSITSKVIDIDVATSEGFSIDLAKGILTLPDGRRGRTASTGVSQDTLEAALANLRK